jgi:segregation and condensation protein A
MEPMQLTLEDYRVDLDCYHGPLDLLLYLVRRHEIDLHNLPIAQLTDQYLQYIRRIEQVDVNLAGEFLVMAATLLEIKSQMLLPPASPDDPQSESADSLSQGDPRYELVQQLLAYKRYKDAAMDLEDRQREWSLRYPLRPARPVRAGDDADESPAVEIDLDDANVMDLCEAFARILDSIGKVPAQHQVTYDDTPIELHAEDILDRLKREGPLTLLATLELVRQRKLQVVQDSPGGEISLVLRSTPDQAPGEEGASPDWRNPQTGEMEYDWPDERQRRRAERRAKMRITRAAKAAEGGEASAEAPAGDEDDLDEEDAHEAGDDPAHEASGAQPRTGG